MAWRWHCSDCNKCKHAVQQHVLARGYSIPAPPRPLCASLQKRSAVRALKPAFMVLLHTGGHSAYKIAIDRSK
jgi:hypothetical protein